MQVRRLSYFIIKGRPHLHNRMMSNSLVLMVVKK